MVVKVQHLHFNQRSFPTVLIHPFTHTPIHTPTRNEDVCVTEELLSTMTDLSHPPLHTRTPLTGICLSPLMPTLISPPHVDAMAISVTVSTPVFALCSLLVPHPRLLPWMLLLLQDQKKNYKAVQSCEEGGSGGAYLEPLVALAQNGANMHNVLGPACIFLRKGFAESRQAVRKSRTISWACMT